ncbi:fimbrial protein [Rahnella aceris]|uniref:fimbrial protein n=1 Tax=Rahnella sp. (strain Y9602) TaxID=2703885 RepID=UPI001C264C65|nr:fimbrial protein [Rahnella aceris]MBU9851474.1 fimbrial protein [Rahnella aceris]
MLKNKSNIKIAYTLSKTMISVLALLCVSSQVKAQCTTQTDPRELTFSPGLIVVPHNQPAGYILYEEVLSDPHGGSTSKIFNCQGGGKIIARNIRGNILKNRIYSTDIAGVGYRLSLAGHAFPWDADVKCNSPVCQRDFPVEPQYKLELIKINDNTITAGTLAPGRYASLKTDGGSDVTYINMGNTSVVPAACTILDNNIRVEMGKFDIKDFTRAGTTLGEKSFNIDLSCDAKMQYSLIFDGREPDIKPSNGLIALDQSTGSASGIALRVKYHNQPVELRKNINFTADELGATSLVFSIEYFQLKDQVKAGKANGRATFNIVYD